MLLGRLFERLFELGVVVVATSNVPPSELYKEGLNRALFLPFIALMERRMKVVRLAARVDFRLEKLAGTPVWYVPADNAAAAALDEAWRRLTSGQPGQAQVLPTKGRTIRIPRAAMGVARFSFQDLCGEPLAGERLSQDRARVPHHLARSDSSNGLRPAERGKTLHHFRSYALRPLGQARRLRPRPSRITFIAPRKASKSHEFKRTASRLIEMRSQEYLALPHGRSHALATGSTEGIVET